MKRTKSKFPGLVFKSGRRVGKFKNVVKNFTDQEKKDLNKAFREAALKVMNDLAEISPEWDGTFKNSWVATPVNGKGVAKNGSFRYKLSDIPKLSIEGEQFLKATKFEISNTSRYADFAMDLIPGRFFIPKESPDPNGEVVGSGKRDITRDTKRGEISPGDGKARITAPLDWYINYLNGGGLQKSIDAGFVKAFKFRK
jgi:hypothetical protein